MKRIAVVVEGRTENNFVKNILRHELKDAEVIARNMHGGNISVPHVLKYIRPLLCDKFDCVATMVDFYRFTNPGRKSGADDIQRELAEAVGQNNHGKTVFLPYVQQHEFEALLFADRGAVCAHLDLSAAQRGKLNAIKGAPENIDHDMPPSRRLTDICPEYAKAVDGIAIIRKIGLAKIARECPRFGGWLAKLKKIARR